MLKLRKNEPRVIALTTDAALPGERRLILKRLRPPPRRLARPRIGRLILTALLAIVGLLKKPELLRKIGPHDASIPDHLWEEARHLQSINARLKL